METAHLLLLIADFGLPIGINRIVLRTVKTPGVLTVLSVIGSMFA